MTPPRTGDGTGGISEIWRLCSELRDRMADLESRDEYSTQPALRDLREDLDALSRLRREEHAAIMKMLWGALLGLGALLFQLVRPKLGL